MDLTKILSVNGLPGLYLLIGQMKNGVVAASLTDGKRFPIYAANKISSLEDIQIYGQIEDVHLKKIFKIIYKKEAGKAITIDLNSGAAIRSYFEGVFPEYDSERVYNSDIKKVIKWYNILIEKDMISFEPETETKNEPETETKNEPETEVETVEKKKKVSKK